MFTQRNKHCPRQWQSGVMASAALENHWFGQFNCLCQGFLERGKQNSTELLLPGQLWAPVISSPNPLEQPPLTLSRLSTHCSGLQHTGSLSCMMEVSYSYYSLHLLQLLQSTSTTVTTVYMYYSLQSLQSTVTTVIQVTSQGTSSMLQ